MRGAHWLTHVGWAAVVAVLAAVVAVIFWGVIRLLPEPWSWAVLVVLFVLGYGTWTWFADPRRGFK